MKAVVVRNRHTGETLALRRVMRDGVLSLELKGSLPPRNEGPPLHIHHIEVEEGVVVAGTLGAILNGERLRVTAGQRAQFPAGAAHRWWNDGDDTLVFEGYSAPLGDLDRYLQAPSKYSTQDRPAARRSSTWPTWRGGIGARRPSSSLRHGFRRYSCPRSC
jgi:mannose-6-phosphate isomerase-like protein (cupin superfamily)